MSCKIELYHQKCSLEKDLNPDLPPSKMQYVGEYIFNIEELQKRKESMLKKSIENLQNLKL